MVFSQIALSLFYLSPNFQPSFTTNASPQLNWVSECPAGSEVHSEGCSAVFKSEFNNIGLAIGVVVGCIVLFELFCIIAACISKKSYDQVA